MLLCPDCNAKMQYNLVVVFLSALFETGRMIIKYTFVIRWFTILNIKHFK